MKRLISVAVLATLIGCQGDTPLRTPGDLPSTGAVLATVNGHEIRQGVLDATLDALPPQIRAQVEATSAPEAMVEQLAAQELLYREALTRGLEADADVQTRMALAERAVLQKAVIDAVVAERTTEAAARSWYDEHLVQFSRAQVNLASIVVADEALANQTLTDLKGGADFAALALERTLDPKAKLTGGDMGWFEVDRVLPQMKADLEKAVDGEIIGPIALGGAFHVFKVLAKRATAPFEEVQGEITERLQAEITETYLKEIVEGATIVAAGNEAVPGIEPPSLPTSEPSAAEANEG